VAAAQSSTKQYRQSSQCTAKSPRERLRQPGGAPTATGSATVTGPSPRPRNSRRQDTPSPRMPTVEGEGELLGELAIADVFALRLAAQVMRHKAELDSHPLVADYFARLGDVATGELAVRGDALSIIATPTPVGLAPGADAEDRRVLGEYLTLLVANDRLSAALRDLSRQLRARDCR
jgi:hypothetical protein